MRIRPRTWSTVAGVLLGLVIPACARPSGELPRTGAAWSASPGEAAVRDARRRFNDAIVRRDTIAIANLLLPDYLIVTGRSVQRRGRAAAMAMWADAVRDTAMRYVRTTRAVHLNDRWGLAEELGDWTGRVTAAEGAARPSGVYAAKWQRGPRGDWRLQAEIFTTLACEGAPSGCAPPDPIAP
jgi:ketosteroid isomerase-like protein